MERNREVIDVCDVSILLLNNALGKIINFLLGNIVNFYMYCHLLAFFSVLNDEQ